MKNSKTIAIIQARMKSSRLPGKVLMSVEGKPMLWHVVKRVECAKLVDQVVVATSMSKSDAEIVGFCKKNKIEVFAGSEDNVLSRYYQAARKYGASVVVRITADCPLIDPVLISETISKLKEEKLDHVGVATGAGALENVKKYPDGLDCSAFTFKALEKARNGAITGEEKEHVTLYIWRRPKEFKLGTVKSTEDYSHVRLTVDHKEDLMLIRRIYKALYQKNRDFYLSDIIALLKRQPNLLSINKKYIGREGYDSLWQKGI